MSLLLCQPILRLFLSAFVWAAVLSASAMGQGFGVGIIAGNPTGLSVKKWLDNGDAIDAAAAWSFDDHGAFQLHGDYLWHRDIASLSDGTYGWMPFYFGIGGRVGFYEGNRWHDDETRVGARIPLGVTYVFRNTPLDIFFEVVPTLDVAPRTDVELDAAVGIRFYLR